MLQKYELILRVEHFKHGCPPLSAFRLPVSCPGLKLDSTFIMKCPATTVTVDQLEWSIQRTDQWQQFIEKRSSGNKIWQICPFPALWNNAGCCLFLWFSESGMSGYKRRPMRRFPSLLTWAYLYLPYLSSSRKSPYSWFHSIFPLSWLRVCVYWRECEMCG